MTPTKERLLEARRLAEHGWLLWSDEFAISIIDSHLKLMEQMEEAVKVLEKIAKNTYGTELCNTEEENNEILARLFFSHQNYARAILAKWKEGIE